MMYSSVRRVFFFSLLAWFVGFPCLAQETADILEHARPAVVTVFAADEQGHETRQGSGFFVRSDGIILTAWHVVAGAYSVKVKDAQGKEYNVIGAYGVNRDKDFVLLNVNANKVASIPIANTITLRPGEKVIVIGSPLGLEQTVSEGIIASIREDAETGKSLQITAPISPGSSGGPVLNAQGLAIGLVRSTIQAGQNLNFATSLSQVQASLNPLGHLVPFADLPENWFERGLKVIADYKANLDQPDDPANIRPKHTTTEDAIKQIRAIQTKHFDVYDKARNYFMNALMGKPDWPDAFYWVGNCDVTLGNDLSEKDRKPYDEAALMMLRAAIKLKSDYPEAYLKMALAQDALNHWSESLEAFHQAIRLKPDYDEAHCSLGMAYFARKENAEAVDELQQAAKLNPHHPFAVLFVAIIYMEENKLDDALEAIKRQIRSNPDQQTQAEDFYFMANILNKLGRKDEADEALDKAHHLSGK